MPHMTYMHQRSNATNYKSTTHVVYVALIDAINYYSTPSGASSNNPPQMPPGSSMAHYARQSRRQL